ncbi:MAG: DUF1501 domain-containing protein [Pirellulales bacterium]
MASDVEAASRELHQTLNSLDREARGAEAELTARMRAYELAAKMQLAVPRVVDLSAETAQTQKAYGLEREETRDLGEAACLPAD